ncbi:hypothetical protein L596_029560 [Steinernema carpocapsae]|uniref:Cathepsin propeptide inhibitor domain-containing protein n=1 Tax=Steinernema carpocapsae TaxID=34508 RepID=A0A4U5LV11_STECR|nr:hypothetical protein L596_029560 [Steinernema carpocapsae]
MLLAIFLVLPFTVVCDRPFPEEFALWHNFLIAHPKSYSSQAEYSNRFGIFVQNLRLAKDRNELEEGSATFGWNKFSDLTSDEFQERYLMDPGFLHLTKPSKSANIPHLYFKGSLDLPSHFDLRGHKAVTEVKDQSDCGSCWTFSTTGAIESAYAVKYGELYNLSEQLILDCAREQGGCRGGWPVEALR